MGRLRRPPSRHRQTRTIRPPRGQNADPTVCRRLPAIQPLHQPQYRPKRHHLRRYCLPRPRPPPERIPARQPLLHRRIPMETGGYQTVLQRPGLPPAFCPHGRQNVENQPAARCTPACLGRRQRNGYPFGRTTQPAPAAHGRRLYPLRRTRLQPRPPPVAGNRRHGHLLRPRPPVKAGTHPATPALRRT